MNALNSVARARSSSPTCISRGRIHEADYDRESQVVQEQRATITTVAPAPLFTQQQSLRTLVDDRDGMTAGAQAEYSGPSSTR
jgi:hypothetical protein